MYYALNTILDEKTLYKDAIFRYNTPHLLHAQKEIFWWTWPGHNIYLHWNGSIISSWVYNNHWQACCQVLWSAWDTVCSGFMRIAFLTIIIVTLKHNTSTRQKSWCNDHVTTNSTLISVRSFKVYSCLTCFAQLMMHQNSTWFLVPTFSFINQSNVYISKAWQVKSVVFSFNALKSKSASTISFLPE